MSDPKEVLAALLREHATPIPDEGYPGDEYDCCAEEVLQAGWRPPARVIESADDLAALPLRTVVLTETGIVMCRYPFDYATTFGYGLESPWSRAPRWTALTLPVTVLWQPEVSRG